MLSFVGLNVVVTGATGGLGSTVASRLINLGANVVTIDRCHTSNAHDFKAHHYADLSKAEEIGKVVDKISKQFSCIDLLVNCAGIFLPDAPSGADHDTLDKLWQHNTASTVLFTMALEPLLEKSLMPSVVNIGSTDGIVASGGQDCEVGVRHDVLYALTKGAVVAFTRALAMKWSPLGIRVNVICPTVFESPMTETLLNDTKCSQLSSHIPLGRLATKEDITDAIICAHSMKFTTGHVYPVDGGYLCQ